MELIAIDIKDTRYLHRDIGIIG